MFQYILTQLLRNRRFWSLPFQLLNFRFLWFGYFLIRYDEISITKTFEIVSALVIFDSVKILLILLCNVYAGVIYCHSVQCESKKSPLKFSDIYSQTVGNF